MLTSMAVVPGVEGVLGDVERDVVAAEPGDTEHRDVDPFASRRPHPAPPDEHDDSEQHGADHEPPERDRAAREVRARRRG